MTIVQAVTDAPTAQAPPVTVLGVGSPLMGDDGVGLTLLAAVAAASPDPRVEFVDGGTGGLELLPVIQDAERLLILDAVAGAVPGAVVQFAGDQLARLGAAKLSPHQVGLLDVLAAARLTAREPAMAVVGIVPQMVDFQYGLTPVVEAGVPRAVAAAVAVITRWLEEAGTSVQVGVRDSELAAGHDRPGRRAAHGAGEGEELVDGLVLAARGAPDERGDGFDDERGARERCARGGERPGPQQRIGVGAAERADAEPDGFDPAGTPSRGGLGDGGGDAAQQSQFMHGAILPDERGHP
jgi:hydrogenase maturation protease